MSPRRRRTRLLSRYVSHSSFFPTHHPSFLLIHLFFLLNPAFFLVRFSHRPRHSKPTPADPQDKVEKTKAEGKGFFAKFFGSKEKSPKKQKVKTPKVSFRFRFEVARADDRPRSLTPSLPRRPLPKPLPSRLLPKLPSRTPQRSQVPLSLPTLLSLLPSRPRPPLSLLRTPSLRSSLPRTRKLVHSRQGMKLTNSEVAAPAAVETPAETTETKVEATKKGDVRLPDQRDE